MSQQIPKTSRSLIEEARSIYNDCPSHEAMSELLMVAYRCGKIDQMRELSGDLETLRESA